MTTKNTPQPNEKPFNEHEIRLEKVAKLKKLGIDPWPPFKEVTATTIEVLSEFDDNAPQDKVYVLSGRLISRRDHGKTIFANLQDRTGSMQLYIRKDDIGQDLFTLFTDLIDVGDIVWVQGTSFRTKKGEITLKVSTFTLMSKCLYPLPEKYHGLADIEQRYRQRYLDLISNPESQEKFKKRSIIIEAIRQFFLQNNFLEVETPTFHPIPGGAAARPFVTHHNAYDMDLYLRIAPELYLKRLVIGGFERVFEISRNFRNEGISTKHNPEFTSVEYYMAYGDYQKGMELTEQLIKQIIETSCGTLTLQFQDHSLDFSKPFKQMTMFESVRDIGGFSEKQLAPENVDTIFKELKLELRTAMSYGEKLFALFEECVEEKLIQPTFITHYPVEVSPLARQNEENKEIVDRFELFMCGMEFANGFTELNNPFVQAERFKQQVAVRETGDEEAHYYDADFVHALEYGLPPTVGAGMGIDRLVMLLTNTTSIKDVILFPTLKPKE
jgi:lysyl-tRNA synthetase class 2